VLVPAVPAFIQKVDTEQKVIVIEPVPGLFEEFDED
jgi:ribosomal 30S subunit maturation factor RimM